MTHILDPNFQYTSAEQTDIAKTFQKARDAIPPMEDGMVMRRLRALAVYAFQKMHRNRFKDQKPGVVGKWPEQGVTSLGRTWRNVSIEALLDKLHEEVDELCEARITSEVREEAGDVTAMSMMVMDNLGASPSEKDVPKIVCLCGSTKFKEAFFDANFRETMNGNIVLSVGFFHHADKGYTPTTEEKVALDHLHKRKIDLADEILVLNVDGYIGESTRSEISYAYDTGKGVRYLEPLNPQPEA